jgi:uncharacterized protein (TIGR00369 family)
MSEGKKMEPDRGWTPLANADPHCFGCGSKNPHGLQMRFETNGKMVRSRVAMEERFRGWNNIIHGGILSTLFDEIMGWTVICLTKRFMLTKTIRVTFKKPVRVGALLTVTGTIKERVNDRRALVEGKIHDESGDLCAVSEGEFALFTKERFVGMRIVPEEDLAAIEKAIA